MVGEQYVARLSEIHLRLTKGIGAPLGGRLWNRCQLVLGWELNAERQKSRGTMVSMTGRKDEPFRHRA